jgi:hypothetical protein
VLAVSVEDYNRRVAEAMDRAQRALGIRSAEAFARALAERVGGAPAGSTYRRWLQAQQAVPGWALLAASEISGLSLDTLVGEADLSKGQGTATLADQVGELQRQVETLRRQVADLQVEAMDRAGAEPVAEAETDETRRRAFGA